MCAEKKGIDAGALTDAILTHGGPKFSGTKADNVKFHDDKSLYTGVYAQGGPTNVDKTNPATSFGGLSIHDNEEEEKKDTAKKNKLVAV